MNTNRNAVYVGTFMIITVILIVVSVIQIAGFSALFALKQTRAVLFLITDDIGGLRVGDDVRLGGLKVGAVQSIDVVTGDETPDQQAELIRHFGGALTLATLPKTECLVVVFKFPEKFKMHASGVRVTIQSTIVGQAWVNIDRLGSGPELAAGVPVTGQPSGIMQIVSSLGAKVTEFVDNANKESLPKINALLDTYRNAGEDLRTKTVPKADTFLDTYNGLAVDIRKDWPTVRDKYYGVADSGTAALTNIKDLIGPSNTDFRTTLANAKDITTTLKEKTPSIMDKVDAMATSINERLTQVKDSLENVKRITGDTATVVTNNRSRLEAIIKKANDSMDNIKAFTAEIKARPWRFVYGPGRGDLGNLALFDSAREFSQGASALADAAAALRDASANPNISPAELKELQDHLDVTFGNFKQVESNLFEKIK